MYFAPKKYIWDRGKYYKYGKKYIDPVKVSRRAISQIWPDLSSLSMIIIHLNQLSYILIHI